jgi:Mn-dependent DtxR family transcriptional regulator
MNALMTRSGRPTTSDDEHPTPVERSYLEVISYLASRNEPVIAAHLARWMRVRPPTVTNVVQRLERKHLIRRDASGAIELTETGTELANQIVRRHRLLECFLYSIVGIPWHQVHQEAIRLEPSLSPAFEARIEALVGQSTTCPHGNPIPGQGLPPALERSAFGVAFCDPAHRRGGGRGCLYATVAFDAGLAARYRAAALDRFAG